MIVTSVYKNLKLFPLWQYSALFSSILYFIFVSSITEFSDSQGVQVESEAHKVGSQAGQETERHVDTGATRQVGSCTM